MTQKNNSSTPIRIPTCAELATEGKTPDVLFWVGCAGSFDDRAKKVTKSFARILHHADINFAILGTEESCTGDPAKRAGNEFLFQMMALQNIQLLNAYHIKKIVTACPHCFNTLKNEYPELGGQYEVIHHSQFLLELIETGKIKVNGNSFRGKKITYHDPCYLGRANDVYEAPRDLIEKLDLEITEMKRSREKGFCCGAGGAQMFKEAEPGNKEVNIERAEEAMALSPDIIAVGCPFCNTMLTDGIKINEKQDKITVLDLAEMIAQANNL
ncbi:MAG: (Fe-S)-binding protein [Candidatus Competibacteraceae bacterium]|nr:(Fe-S)-binding protein [Candidatus Competibacteraceae bacterium]